VPSTPRVEGGGGPGRILAVIAAMLLLAGSIAALLYWIRKPPRPLFVGVWIDQYTDRHIPPNGWAAQDSASLLGLGWRDKHHFGRQEFAMVREDLRGLSDNSAIVVYLSALAIGGDEGDVALLPGDADLDKPESWLSLREILRLLRDCKADHKLLVLDIMRPFVAPRYGVLADDVATRAEALVKHATEQDRKLLVLSACSAGQTAFESEQLGHSVFGYYMEQGLRGAADGYNERQKWDGDVSARELHAFVQARVDRWAQQNRGIRQTPSLIGTGDDFALLAARGPETKEEQEAEADDAYPAWLLKRSQLLEEWRERPNLRASVSAYRRLDEELTRAERRLRAGLASTEIESILERFAGPFTQERKKREGDLRRLSPQSLADAVVQGRAPPDTAAGDVRSKLHELAVLDARAKGGRSDNAKDVAEFESERTEFLKRFEKQPPFDLAWIVFQTAVDEPRPVPERLRAWSRLITKAWDALPSESRPHYTELDYLQRLAKWSIDIKDGWPAETVHLALKTALQEARASAFAQTTDTEYLSWVDEPRRRADAARAAANDLLFAGKAAEWPKAGPLLTDALTLYETVVHRLESIQEARRQFEDALVLLPAALRALEGNRAAADDAKNVVQEIRKIGDLMRSKVDEGSRDDALKQLNTTVRNLRNRLHGNLARQLFPEQLKALADPPPRERARVCCEIDGMLARSWLSTKDRAVLWQTGRRLSSALNAETLDRDAADDQQRRRTEPPTAWSASHESERELALSRAGFAIELLKLEGAVLAVSRGPATSDRETANKVRELEQLRKNAENQPLHNKIWDDLRRALREAWAHVRRNQSDQDRE
jgi:hypothetical protein